MERTIVSRVFQICLDFDRRIRDGGYSQVDKSTLDGRCGSDLPIATNLWNREKDGREKPNFQEKLGFKKRLEVWVGGQCPPYKEVLLWIVMASSSWLF